MRFLIDTCVVSEWKRREPAPTVLAWLNTLVQDDLVFSIPTILCLQSMVRGMKNLDQMAVDEQ